MTKQDFLYDSEYLKQGVGAAAAALAIKSPKAQQNAIFMMFLIINPAQMQYNASYIYITYCIWSLYDVFSTSRWSLATQYIAQDC